MYDFRGGRGYQGRGEYHGRGDRRGQYDQFNQGYSGGDGYRKHDSSHNAFGSSSRSRGGYSSGRGGSTRSRGRGGRGFAADLEEQNPEVEFMWNYPDHTEVVSCMTYDAANGLLYTGCKDGYVNVYTYNPADRKKRFTENNPFKNKLPGAVAGMVCLPGGLLVVAITMAGPGHRVGGLHIANTQQTLQLHRGDVQCLVVLPTSGLICTGGTDGAICAVGLQGESLVQQGALTAAQGGHASGVTALAAYQLQGTQLLLSGDVQGNLKIWDLQQASLLQTLSGAHSKAVTGILSYQDCIISASLDGLVRVWQASPMPAPNAVFNPTPVAEHRSSNGQPPESALTVHGVCSNTGVPWLLVSRHNTNSVEFAQMSPQFDYGGTLARCQDARCIISIDDLPDGERLILVGTSNGQVKSYRWKQQQA